MQNKESQRNLIMNIVNPIELEWSSQNIANSFSSLHYFLESLGIKNEENQTTNVPFISNYAKVIIFLILSLFNSLKKAQYSLHTLSSIWKRVINVSAPSTLGINYLQTNINRIQIPIDHILKITPNLLNLFKCFHFTPSIFILIKFFLLLYLLMKQVTATY